VDATAKAHTRPTAPNQAPLRVPNIFMAISPGLFVVAPA
jgi:hypothetical protein